MTEINTQKQIDNILIKYLENGMNKSEGEPELEVKFGTKGIKNISKIDFDNVIQYLKSVHFQLEVSNSYSLKMQNEFLDKKTGKTKLSLIRIEINGLYDVQKYCKNNSLNDLKPVFLQKKDVTLNGEKIYPVNVNDFNFRITYKNENKINPMSSFAEKIKSDWENQKKNFRYINRSTFIHPDYPFRVDMSIVKENAYEKNELRGKTFYRPKPEYTFQSANVLNNSEKYEIEIEIINEKVGPGTNYTDSKKIGKDLKKVIKYILGGLQKTSYPISYNEMKTVGEEYLRLIHEKNFNEKMKMIPKFFLGPSSMTLQIQNIAPINDDSNIPNIRNNYTVTEKADGLRKLLFINKKGLIYLIDTNLNIQFTGAQTKNIELHHSILDGEHILHNKKGQFINLFAAFDIYILNKKNVMSLPFVPPSSSDENIIYNNYRLPLLVNFTKNLGAISVVNDKPTPIRVQHKNFKAENENQSIFLCCETILNNEKQGLFEYEVDGLIFTPANLGVGVENKDDISPLTKSTWVYSFKWKPAEFNTIDFLCTTKKNVNGEDFIGTVFEDGLNTTQFTQLTQFKTLVLRVGFDEKKHGFLNPCLDVLEDKLPNYSDIDNEESYKPLPFYPTNPYDAEANLCNIILREDENGNSQMFTEEEQVFTDNTIVEFKYDFTRENKWRWIPLRVRYDKTEEYKKGFKQFGNAYHVANNNWHTIHNPITKKMISTGENIPNELADDDVYYNRISGTSQTEGLRDFHNLYVKKILINSISKPGNNLIDYAVGKGGDFPKWIYSKLSFVYGIDISKDNIENRLDGACARYLNYRKKFKNMPSVLFSQGNSAYSINDGEAFYDEKSKQIAKAIFGEGPKDKNKLGLGVYRHYGVAKDGFNVSSCQFALHYFFENKRTLNGFLRNISDCTKLNGYFIGGCYDGEKIFNMLQNIKTDDSISIFEKGKKMWEVTKKYDRDIFNDDETSLGFPINVYQDSINKSFIEYLVNFNYLTRVLENYGFELLNKTEMHELELNLPQSIGSFQQLYGLFEEELDKNKKVKNYYGKSSQMTINEKKISFLNNYFIYKKVRNVDTRSVYNMMIGSSKFQNEMEKLDEEIAENIVEKIENEKPKKEPKKMKKKIKLVQNSKSN
jgi:hypothetical protein